MLEMITEHPLALSIIVFLIIVVIVLWHLAKVFEAGFRYLTSENSVYRVVDADGVISFLVSEASVLRQVRRLSLEPTFNFPILILRGREAICVSDGFTTVTHPKLQALADKIENALFLPSL